MWQGYFIRAILVGAISAALHYGADLAIWISVVIAMALVFGGWVIIVGDDF
jgi:hypothetical protein